MNTPNTELAPLLFTFFIAILLVGTYVLARITVFLLTIDYKLLYESFLDTLAGLRSETLNRINYFEDLDDE